LIYSRQQYASKPKTLPLAWAGLQEKPAWAHSKINRISIGNNVKFRATIEGLGIIQCSRMGKQIRGENTETHNI